MLFQNIAFNLLEKTAAGKIVEISSRGVWLIVNNSCLNWITTVPLLKMYLTEKEKMI